MAMKKMRRGRMMGRRIDDKKQKAKLEAGFAGMIPGGMLPLEVVARMDHYAHIISGLHGDQTEKFQGAMIGFLSNFVTDETWQKALQVAAGTYYALEGVVLDISKPPTAVQ